VLSLNGVLDQTAEVGIKGIMILQKQLKTMLPEHFRNSCSAAKK